MQHGYTGQNKGIPYLSKLSQELYEGSFSKGIRKAGMEGQGWVFVGEDGNPTFLEGENKVCLLVSQSTACEKPQTLSSKTTGEALSGALEHFKIGFPASLKSLVQAKRN